jgi:cytochrome c-type biogenesis protein CcmH
MTRILVGALFLLGLGTVATAQQPSGLSAIELETQQVASELRCPVCQSTSLNDSPSELAQQMKAVIREQLEAGKTPEEVKAYFVGKYGEWILLRPEPKGFNLVVYLAPLVALVGGALIIVAAVRKWTAPADASVAAEDASDTPGRAVG